MNKRKLLVGGISVFLLAPLVILARNAFVKPEIMTQSNLGGNESSGSFTSLLEQSVRNNEDPSYEELVVLADNLKAEGKHQEAIPYYEQAAEKDPAKASQVAYLSYESYKAINNQTEYKEKLRIATEWKQSLYDSDNDVARLNELATMYVDLGDTEKAKNYYQIILDNLDKFDYEGSSEEEFRSTIEAKLNEI